MTDGENIFQFPEQESITKAFTSLNGQSASVIMEVTVNREANGTTLVGLRFPPAKFGPPETLMRTQDKRDYYLLPSR